MNRFVRKELIYHAITLVLAYLIGAFINWDINFMRDIAHLKAGDRSLLLVVMLLPNGVLALIRSIHY